MHMRTSYRDHTDRNGRLHQPSKQPMNLQMPQPTETHKRSHNDHAQDEGSRKPPLINETPCRKIDAES